MSETATPAADPTPPPQKRRWLRRLAIITLIALVLLALALRFALRPQFATNVILHEAGRALGLEITATGTSEYDISGTPRVVLRGLSARQPGASRELFRAERVYLSLPWETLKSQGHVLDIERIELDAPVLDLAALDAWQKTRPASDETRLPVLQRGLKLVRGEVIGAGWKIDRIGIDIAHFEAGEPLAAHLSGRYQADALSLPFDLSLALSRAATDAGLGLSGQLTPTARDWRMPIRLRLRAPIHFDDGALNLQPARLGAAARYLAGDGSAPISFAFGAYGPARIAASGLDWPQLALALRGQDIAPDLDASGRLAVGEQLDFALAGQLAEWRRQWPALPAPLAQSRSPLPFTARYRGALDFTDPLDLHLQRDATRFDGRFRLNEVIGWIDAPATGAPLPPLDGRLTSPRLEISGVLLEGVEIEIDDPAVPDDTPTQ